MNRTPNYFVKILMMGLLILVASACQRVATKSSSVSLQIPRSLPELFRAQKTNLNSVSGIPIDYNSLCFAVNVTGAGITSSSNSSSCDINRGVFAGSVAPGGTLTIDVPSGDNRTFEVYGLLRSTVTQACPALTDSFGSWPLTSVYLLGTTSNVPIQGTTAEVTVNITLPTPAQNIIAQDNMPSTCGPNTGKLVDTTPSARIGRVEVAAGQLTGTSHKISFRVSEVPLQGLMSGTQMRIKDWNPGQQ